MSTEIGGRAPRYYILFVLRSQAGTQGHLPPHHSAHCTLEHNARQKGSAGAHRYSHSAVCRAAPTGRPVTVERAAPKGDHHCRSVHHSVVTAAEEAAGPLPLHSADFWNALFSYRNTRSTARFVIKLSDRARHAYREASCSERGL